MGGMEELGKTISKWEVRLAGGRHKGSESGLVDVRAGVRPAQ